MMKRKSLLIYIFPFLLIFQTQAEENHWIKKTIDLTINNNFEKASEIVNKQIEKYPGDYRAYFYLAATLNSEMTHFENQAASEQFSDAIDSTVVLIDRILEKEDNLSDSAYAQLLFYKGSAYGYRAFFYGNTGNLIGAISNGIKSVGYLNETLEMDSTVYGAYLGIGVYKYWRYSRLKLISWLPFIPDDRDQGIEMIKQAIVLDSLSRYMAMQQLVYILVDYEKTDEAIPFADKIVDRFPNSQFMWWANAHAYFMNRDYKGAESAFLALQRLITADKNRNFTHLLKCKFKLAFIYKELNYFDKCKKYCEEILSLVRKSELSDKAQEIVSWTEELLDDCQGLMAEKSIK